MERLIDLILSKYFFKRVKSENHKYRKQTGACQKGGEWGDRQQNGEGD